MPRCDLPLDTNICIAFLNEKDPILRARLAGTSQDEVRLCTIVKAELFYGARNGTRVEQNLARLARLFELFDCVPFDAAAAHHYGVLRAQLRRSGTAVGANDMLIAAIALAADLTLVTRDQAEFHHIGGLRVEAW